MSVKPVAWEEVAERIMYLKVSLFTKIHQEVSEAPVAVPLKPCLRGGSRDGDCKQVYIWSNL